MREVHERKALYGRTGFGSSIYPPRPALEGRTYTNRLNDWSILRIANCATNSTQKPTILKSIRTVDLFRRNKLKAGKE